MEEENTLLKLCLDALTIINRKGKIEGLKIAICGDILTFESSKIKYLLNEYVRSRSKRNCT